MVALQDDEGSLGHGGGHCTRQHRRVLRVQVQETSGTRLHTAAGRAHSRSVMGRGWVRVREDEIFSAYHRAPCHRRACRPAPPVWPSEHAAHCGRKSAARKYSRRNPISSSSEPRYCWQLTLCSTSTFAPSADRTARSTRLPPRLRGSPGPTPFRTASPAARRRRRPASAASPGDCPSRVAG